MAGGPILALTKGIIYLCPDSALLTALCCQLCIKTKIVSFSCHHWEPLWRMADQTKYYSQPSSQPPHIFVLRLHFDRPYICVVAYTYHFCCIYITFCGIPKSKSCIYIYYFVKYIRFLLNIYIFVAYICIICWILLPKNNHITTASCTITEKNQTRIFKAKIKTRRTGSFDFLL